MSRERTKARRCAVQGLYQWQLTGNDISFIEAQFIIDQDMSGVEVPYFQELLHKVPAHLHELEENFEALLDRPIDELDPVERAILRISTYEMAYRPEIPYRVVINEAVELAKTFGADQSHKYVNSIMDGVARKLRAIEVEAAGRNKPAAGKPQIKYKGNAGKSGGKPIGKKPA